MTASVSTGPGFLSRFINGLLAIKPVASFAKSKARKMMIDRAENMGVPWTIEARSLQNRNWDKEFQQVQNPTLVYPDYYLRSFHAYDQGNLSWEAASEVEVAAKAVHAHIWKDAGPDGDCRLRDSYHEVLSAQIADSPQAILDLGCSVGMSTVALQKLYPQATLTGLDLSPYFLAVAQYKSEQHYPDITWVHAAAESTGLADASFDLVSSCLMFHELPADASRQILQEARRLLRPGGHLAIMDMNPQSEIYAKMPPYILTLLKSTEPYLDQYFSLDIEPAFVEAGFEKPTITRNSPRHRTIIAQVKNPG
ncbi:class I SAM-dependent methyltransferase [Oscillatoria acuminata]|uniref:Methylase involved in ubiquinone/menaquinone biosynthesis n=1 Tax=Oscillatoria acuminata PCC 6304 TaxID=56110 RepID=K9TGA6_9CYAN|nr:class I SAM-dependent methyltransferase [Oscillatoria acuminata]AFY81585.1 methylase involved in ubiquinone/menaquinone biosynthesis [Oscillatoria acuminata PCC 6304]